MHRIDTPTAQVDKFGAGKNGFTAGNPQTGELPTALDQDYFDSIQEEIAAVIEGAAIALVKGSRSQLLTAMKKLFLQSGNNLSEIVDTVAALNKLGGAPLASPTFTGNPKGPTAAAETNSTQLATTAFVQVLIAGLLKTSNNLSEIAAAGPAAVAATLANLGLGEAAKRGVGTGENQIPDMSYFTSLKATNGWQKLPGGLIIQWGAGTYNNTTVNLPIAFPNVFAAATVSPDPDATLAVELADIYPKSNSTAFISCSYSTSGGGWTAAALKCTWMAIGY